MKFTAEQINNYSILVKNFSIVLDQMGDTPDEHINKRMWSFLDAVTRGYLNGMLFEAAFQGKINYKEYQRGWQLANLKATDPEAWTETANRMFDKRIIGNN